MKKIVSKVILIFFLCILMIVCYKKYIKKENYISIFGKSFFIVYSGSMKPEIDVGELLIVSKKDEYKINDVITFEKDGKVITHRIINFSNDEIITKGDNNNVEDSGIKSENIIGKVIFHSKMLGIIYIVFLKPIIIIYILLILFFIIYENYKKVDIKEVNEKI